LSLLKHGKGGKELKWGGSRGEGWGRESKSLLAGASPSKSNRKEGEAAEKVSKGPWREMENPP